MGDLEQLHATGERIAAALREQPAAAACSSCGEAYPVGDSLPGARARGICLRCQEDTREGDEALREWEESRRRALIDDLRATSTAGSRLAVAGFAHAHVGAHNRAAYQTAEEWLRQRDRNLLIQGGVGAGKSYLAACLHHALLDQLTPSYWLNAADYVYLRRRCISDESLRPEAQARLIRAQTTELLVLDDLGKNHRAQKGSGWHEDTFYELIEARYRDCRPIIVTAEHDGATLMRSVGESVVSRLAHDAVLVRLEEPPGGYRRPAEVSPANAGEGGGR